MAKQDISFITRYSMLFTTIALCLLFSKLNSNLESEFKHLNDSYKANSAINLEIGTKAKGLSDLLLLYNYVQEPEDANFIAAQIIEKLNDGKELPNLYELNKLSFRVPAFLADSLGGKTLKDRVRISRANLGIDAVITTKQNEILSDTLELDNGMGQIQILVKERDTTANAVKRVLRKNQAVVPDVLIQLREHFYNDSLQKGDQRILGHVKTNDKGLAVFNGLDTSRYYSVLPIKKGFEYGTAQGTVGGSLGAKNGGEREFSFIQREHTICLFNDATYKQIREDGVITVRKPADFQKKLTVWLLCFFVAWWGLYFVLLQKKSFFNRNIISILMLLTGCCLLMMFSIPNPLTDKMLGIDMAQGVIAGVVLIGVFQFIDFVRFFQDGYAIKFDFVLQFINWSFKPFRQKVKPLIAILKDRKLNRLVKYMALVTMLVVTPLLILDLLQLPRLSNRVERLWTKMPKGIGYLLVALIMTVLLWSPFGEVIGGMKVNLNILGLRFQPSEITKYLIIVFMSAFFYRNVDRIVKYSETGNSSLFWHKTKGLLGILIGLGILSVAYIALGDMGPALVLGISFILLYSLIKSKNRLSNLLENEKYKRIFSSDFAMLIYGTISFALMLWAGHRLGAMGIFCLLWFVFWIGGCLAWRKQVFESAVFMNLIVAAFIFGGSLLQHTPLDSEGERLESRKEMCINTWGIIGVEDGELQSASVNDQIAQGLWGLASGGLTGQGLGKGNPNFIPAFHTDMILESIGEQMGWLGLLIVVVFLALLLRQSIVAGYQTGHSFAFYLAAGITIVTGVQFMVIALGSTGVIPLTGVTVPFLSFGKVSMILNLAAFGVILSLSHRNSEATEVQRKNIESYNDTIAISSMLYTILAVFVLLVFFKYQTFDRQKTLVRPVFVNNASGAPVVEYNPRIALLMRELHAGNIYDREGRILATNDKAQIKAGDYIGFGVDEDHINATLKKRQQRYYPFGDHLLFMVGDYNTGIPFAYYDHNPIGYLAESQHLAALRGFDNIKYDESGNPLKVNLSSDKYRENAFLPLRNTTYNTVLRDYSEIAKYLKNHNRIARFNAKREKRDIQLTVDAELQTKMQNAIEEYVSNNFVSQSWNKLRISVVVLNASNGEMLTSANYPLPDQEILRNAPNRYDEKDFSTRAYTDRDLGLTYQTMPGSTAKVMSALAGLQKYGRGISDTTYYIDARETVEPPSDEPNFQRDLHETTMEEAIRLSSNNYFINLVNDKELYGNLSDIYQAIGIRVPHTEIVNGRKVSRPLVPYFFTPGYDSEDKSKYRSIITSVGDDNIRAYRDYIEKRDKDKIFEQMSGYHGGHDWNKMAWAWGQYDMGASPLNMARIVAVVANKGTLVETRFIKQGNNTLKVPKEPNSLNIVTPDAADVLKQFMQGESAKHKRFPAGMGGKTGTPERELRRYAGGVDKNGNPRMSTVKLNDGWYIFFIDSPKENAPLAAAVRMERLPEARGNTSGRAVELTDKVVLRILGNLNYIDSK